MAVYRQGQGLTQEELGRRLGGWSGPSVSAAERSVDGKRVKKFDADELVAISLALGVPLVGLFLPPRDDGISVRYRLRVSEDARIRSLDMRGLMELAVMPDSDEETPEAQEYRDRFNNAANRYLDPEWAAVVARWLRDSDTPQLRSLRAARLLARRDELLETAKELKDIADAITKDGEEGSS